MTVLRFEALPLPYYINSGFSLAGPGRKHPERSEIGEFDLIVVMRGCMYIGEEGRNYEVSEGHSLILRPDLHHYPTEGCRELTGSFWLHFQAGGVWRAEEEDGEAEEEADGMDGGRFGEKTAGKNGGKTDGNSDGKREGENGGENDESTGIGEGEWPRQPRFAIELPQFARLPHPSRMYALLQRLIDLNRDSHMDAVRWEQQATFQQALMLLSETLRARRPRPGEELADRAASYLRSRYKEPISSRDLAEALNFHPVYIARLMRRQFGCSPMDYLIRYRLEQAKLLLRQTDLTVGRVALETGFRQAAYFAACFGRHEGVSPREFRQRFRKSGVREIATAEKSSIDYNGK